MVDIGILAAGAVGGAGLLTLLQSKSGLPSKADYDKAMLKLRTEPNDPDASTVAGKYICFVEGDWENGLILLKASNDATLKNLADHERAPLYADTPEKKLVMGDEWVTAARTFPALFRAFYDRANHWYVAAWPDLKGAWRDKARERGMKIAVARPPGAARKGLPTGWVASIANPGGRAPVLDGAIARTGSYSVKLVPGDEKIKGSYSELKSDPIQVSGKALELTVYVLADGTDTSNDHITLNFMDATGISQGIMGPFVPMDTPFWNRLMYKADLNPKIARIEVAAAMHSRKGAMWVDDFSVKIDGKEVLKNGSFEEK